MAAGFQAMDIYRQRLKAYDTKTKRNGSFAGNRPDFYFMKLLLRTKRQRIKFPLIAKENWSVVRVNPGMTFPLPPRSDRTKSSVRQNSATAAINGADITVTI